MLKITLKINPKITVIIQMNAKFLLKKFNILMESYINNKRIQITIDTTITNNNLINKI